MIALVIAFVHFFRVMASGVTDRAFRGLLASVVAMLGLGTLVYHYAEGWSFFNSLYFSVVTLTTIGYGDFAPTTVLARAFTIMYIFLGIGLLMSFVSTIAERAAARRQERVERARERRRTRAGGGDRVASSLAEMAKARPDEY